MQLNVNQTVNIDSTFLPYPYTVVFSAPVGVQFTSSPPAGYYFSVNPGGLSLLVGGIIPGSTYIWLSPYSTQYGMGAAINRVYIRDYNVQSNDCNSAVFTGVWKNQALIFSAPPQVNVLQE